MEICQQWYDYDGRRDNISMELEPNIPCPCTLNQALADVGRFTSALDCDMTGDHLCYTTRGALHCVISTYSVWTGAGQQCCYDEEGWLMFSDDYEYFDQYLSFYSAGVPFRAHPFGSFAYLRVLFCQFFAISTKCHWSRLVPVQATSLCADHVKLLQRHGPVRLLLQMGSTLRVLLSATSDLHMPNVPATCSRSVLLL